MDHYDFSQYNDNVYAAMNLVEKLNDIIFSLPPFDKIISLPIVKLDDILNGYDCFFENGLSHIVSACYNIDEDFVNEYGYGEKDDHGNYFLRLNRFDLLPLDKKDLVGEDIADDLRELNSSFSSFFDIYIGFLNAYLQVQQIYKPFICDYLHSKEAFQTALCFDEFNREKVKNLEHIKCRMKSFGYKSIADEKGEHILCEEIKFSDIVFFCTTISSTG